MYLHLVFYVHNTFSVIGLLTRRTLQETFVSTHTLCRHFAAENRQPVIWYEERGLKVITSSV